MSLSLSAKLRCARGAFEQSTENIPCETVGSGYAQIQFYIDQYVECMGNMSNILHPYLQGNIPQGSLTAQARIGDELEKIEQIVKQCHINDTYNLLGKTQNQTEDVCACINIWHNLVEEYVKENIEGQEHKKWFIDKLLPQTYWEQALAKTRHKPARLQIKQHLELCRQNISTQEMPEAEKYSQLQDKAKCLCSMFQRASSQVEGRNGYLSQINHNQKGFDKNRLEVMTVVHNFDTRGADGQTPAERLFGDKLKFEPLFEYIIQNIGEMPRPRKRRIRI